MLVWWWATVCIPAIPGRIIFPPCPKPRRLMRDDAANAQLQIAGNELPVHVHGRPVFGVPDEYRILINIVLVDRVLLQNVRTQLRRQLLVGQVTMGARRQQKPDLLVFDPPGVELLQDKGNHATGRGRLGRVIEEDDRLLFALGQLAQARRPDGVCRAALIWSSVKAGLSCPAMRARLPPSSKETPARFLSPEPTRYPQTYFLCFQDSYLPNSLFDTLDTYSLLYSGGNFVSRIFGTRG